MPNYSVVELSGPVVKKAVHGVDRNLLFLSLHLSDYVAYGCSS